MKVLYVIIISELQFTCNIFVIKTVDKRLLCWKIVATDMGGSYVAEKKLKVTNVTYVRVRYGAYVIRAVPKNWKLKEDDVFHIFCEDNDTLMLVKVRYTCNLDGYFNVGFIRTL